MVRLESQEIFEKGAVFRLLGRVGVIPTVSGGCQSFQSLLVVYKMGGTNVFTL